MAQEEHKADSAVVGWFMIILLVCGIIIAIDAVIIATKVARRY